MAYPKVFITTTLPYANSTPHMGHAFEFILADIIARNRRANGYEDVRFNVGLDEHGTKIYEAALAAGLQPQEYLDLNAEKWIEFCKSFNISYDNFYRTSSGEHAARVGVIWSFLKDQGDIYKREYTGLYCKGCESYKTKKELVNGLCPDHPIEGYVTEQTEMNWTFKLSKYVKDVKSYLGDEFLIPDFKWAELHNLMDDAEDISVSRSAEKCPWGIEVPDDPTQTIYVWFDALLNYIFAADYSADSYWENEVIQLCGPDNLRFQAIIFQCLLMAIDIRCTDKLLVHGTILDGDGKKMSKTLGNTVDPIDQVNKYGLNAVRYYCTVLNTCTNSAWSELDLVNRFNADICNDWGNFVSRVLHLCDIKADKDKIGNGSSDDMFLYLHKEYVWKITKAFDKLDIKEAYRLVNELVKFGNEYINKHKPWELAGDELHKVLNDLLTVVLLVNDFYKPLFPDECALIYQAYCDRKKVIAFKKIEKVLC